MADSMACGTAPAPWSASTSAAIRRSTPRMNVPVPTAGSANVTSAEARPELRPKCRRSTSSTRRTMGSTTSDGV